MSLSSLQPLKDNRDALLLAEVAALLHDVGKLHKDFVIFNPRQPLWAKYHHLVLRRIARGITIVPTLTPQMINVAIIAGRSALNNGTVDERELKKEIRNASSVSDNQAEVLLGEALVEDDFLTSSLINLLELTHFTVANEQVVIGDIIEEHATPFFSRSNQQRNNRKNISKLLQHADFCDSSADKGSANSKQISGTYTSNAFGIEIPLQIISSHEFCDSIVQQWGNRQNLLKCIEDIYRSALGETRRCANDVTLWDHSYSVSSLFKSALAEVIFVGWPTDYRNTNWRLLRVNFDVLGLYAKSIKIADLLGYQRAVDEACERVKHLVEYEYPLGNEIYRDTTGIYFTFPDIDLPADLAQEISSLVEKVEPELAPRIAVTVGDGQTATEQLKGILAKARREALQALAQPFDGQNLSTCWQHHWEVVGEGKWEICPVCRLRPMREGEEACEICLKRRGSRIREWLDNPETTIWMDEIADHNDRVALIVGKFGLDDWLSGDLVQTMLVKAEENNPAGCTPKNPSPARLRRVWETCQRFWSETVQGILNTLSGRERWLLEVEETGSLPPAGVVCGGTLNGSPISVWRMDDSLLTISFVPEKPKPGQLSVSWEQNGHKNRAKYQVMVAREPPADYIRYHPTLTLLTSPDQFLAFVPAADALDIARKIQEEYTKQFGKVQNRLPLFLGLVFFQRKMPLFAVMETARRMLEAPLGEEPWTVECCRSDEDGHVQHLRLSQGEERFILKVPIKMGDGNPDYWYPYVFVEHFADATPDNRQHRFQHNGRWLVHVSDLKEDDVVKVTPSCFAYLWLEHTAKRFEFDPEKHLMLLDELPRMMEMWERLRKSGITITGLRNLQALLEAKGAAWGMTSGEFRHLAETALKDAGLFQRKDWDGNPMPDAITPNDVVSKRFAHCLELYLHILKQRLRED